MRFLTLTGLLVLTAAGCRPSIGSEAKAAGSNDVRTVNATTAAVIEKPISRFVSATGTLTAEDQADVSAEVAGRVVATPVERGTLVSEGAELIRRKLKRYLIQGEVTRERHRPLTPSPYATAMQQRSKRSPQD